MQFGSIDASSEVVNGESVGMYYREEVCCTWVRRGAGEVTWRIQSSQMGLHSLFTIRLHSCIVKGGKIEVGQSYTSNKAPTSKYKNVI